MTKSAKPIVVHKPITPVLSGDEADAELVKQACNGSLVQRQEAFSVLVTRYEGFVRGMLFSLCRHRHAADDLSQEAFLKAWTKLSTLSKPQSFKSWLKQLAYRQFLHQYRHAKVEQKHAEHSREEPATDLQVDDDLQRMLSLCSPLEREIMILCYGFEFTHAEIAEQRGMAIGTVKSHVHRAKQKMQAYLEGEQVKNDEDKVHG